MPRHSSPIRSPLFLAFFAPLLLLSACNSTPAASIPLSSASSLFVFRFAPPALLEFDADFSLARELPLNLPCPLTATHAAPRGRYLALELECNNGPLVQIVDTLTGEVKTPFTDADSHFLAWDFEDDLILRVDALGNTRLVRVTPTGRADPFDLPAQTYDMDFAPNGQTLIYSFTRGLGLGSELWAATVSGSKTWQLRAERDVVVTFARWSPDGTKIAFINMPDTSTPFSVGELWLTDANGNQPQLAALADAGHGFAPAWSPDSTRLAFVRRDNPDDPKADQVAGALISNIYIRNITTEQMLQVTHFNKKIVEAPVWSADGTFLAFSVVALNDTIAVWIADLIAGQVTRLETAGPACCPAWIRK
jgi:Tol biopolymer transport system component